MINHFTTAEIQADMTNHNIISREMDLNGVFGYPEEKVYEKMTIAVVGYIHNGLLSVH